MKTLLWDRSAAGCNAALRRMGTLELCLGPVCGALAAEPILPISAATRHCATASGGSFLPVISADGRQVGFLSYAHNLVTHDNPSLWLDVFVRDRAGTDPTNLLSVLSVLTVTSPGSSTTTVLWSAVPGRTYRVQFKDEPGDAGWADLPGLVTPEIPTGVQVDASANGRNQRFYRVLLAP